MVLHAPRSLVLECHRSNTAPSTKHEVLKYADARGRYQPVQLSGSEYYIDHGLQSPQWKRYLVQMHAAALGTIGARRTVAMAEPKDAMASGQEPKNTWPRQSRR